MSPLTPSEVRAFRSDLGISQARLAEAIGSSSRTIEDWEAGRREPPAILRLALAAVNAGLAPWRERDEEKEPPSFEDVALMADRHFWESAEGYQLKLHELFLSFTEKDKRPGFALLLARMLTAKDGYNDVQLGFNWSNRPSSGWQTTMVVQPEIKLGIEATFGFEARDGKISRQLALFIDDHRPGERLPEKLARETALLATGIRVLSLTEAEIFANPSDCGERVEGVLFDMIEQCMIEAGTIPPPPPRAKRLAT